MSQAGFRRLVWIFWGLIAVGHLARLPVELHAAGGTLELLPLLGRFLWTIFPLIFSAIGALIVTRQAQNPIGWLLLVPAGIMVILGPIEAHINSLTAAPPPTFLNFFLLWLSNTGWLLLIFPLILVTLLFPTGRPPSPRWRWLMWAIIALPVLFICLTFFVEEIGPLEDGWRIANPLGFVSAEWLETYFVPVWLISLAAVTILAAASLLVRYRRSGHAVRQQIKWLLYAGGIFTVYYVPLLFMNDELMSSLFGELFDLILILVILNFPLAIGIAILRYRLYDIDLIIRRTVVYTVVTAVLAVVYFGSVVLLQQLTEQLAGGQSPLAIVLSTLGIAALFSPLRRRVQAAVDRRFFRQKYDAQQVLARFARTARDETDLALLRQALEQVVNETIRPQQAFLWLRERQD